MGRGGFGTVYRAELLGQEGFSRPVALKVLNEGMAEDHDFAERLRDEARLLGLLQHRGIVWVDGLVQLDGRWTVVMEYVEGVNLKQLLTVAGPLPVSCAVEIVRRVADAFQYAYEEPAQNGQVLHLLHRDLKPSNIHLTPTGDVKVLDFGVARAEFQTREAETRSLVLGSLEYMAPERLDGIDSHAGDMYALGAVFFELLTGAAFGRSSGNRERHQAHLDQRLDLLYASGADPMVADLIAACLAYDEAKRPTAEELRQRARTLCVRHPDPWLVDWSAAVIPGVRQRLPPIDLDDPLSGSILIEGPSRSFPTPARPPCATASPPPARPPLPFLALFGVIAGLGVLGLVGASAVGGIWWLYADTPALPAPPLAAGVPPAGAPGEAEDGPRPEELLQRHIILEPKPMPPVPEPAPAPAPEPLAREPRIEAEPAPPRPAPSSSSSSSRRRGSVVVQGAVADLRLVGAGGKSYGRGMVPAGDYAVSVSFDGAAYHEGGQVTVHPDEQVVLVCRESLRRCVTR